MTLSQTHVALVGRRLAHNENLGLAYLRAALEAAGAAVRTHYVNDVAELARAIAAILSDRPQVVGLSLSDGGSALLPLALGEALRRASFAGHITCGGQFATLARAWLLERYGWLDSVVRFAGEAPLVALASRVAGGEPVFGVPGVTTRAGDGPPALVLDRTPFELSPKRAELPEILGHPAAHMTATRGCRGRCRYCGPAALHTLEVAEGARAGIAKSTLRAHGVGGVRRRELDAICDEMAELWHDRAVRYFYFVDEHLLPYDEQEGLRFLSEFSRGLRARRVGPFGIGTMLRADRLTPRLVRSFAEAGLVRAFVGLELGPAEDARRFGRPVATQADLALLRTFAEAGVATVSNLMLVHPYSTPETVAAAVDLLEQIPAGVFETTRMMVYHGTRLFERIAQEGRLLGNPLRYGYRFEHPAMQGFAEIFSRLRGEAFWDYSIAYRTHDAYLALALARRLHPERVDRGVGARLEEVRQRVNRLYVETYRRALDLALAGGRCADATPLLATLRAPVGELTAELAGIEQLLLADAPARSPMFAPMRSVAAGIVSFVLSTGAAACGGKAVIDGVSAHGGTGGTGAGGTGTGGTGTGGSSPCPEPKPVATPETVQAVLAAGAACFSGSVTDPVNPPPVAAFSVLAYTGLADAFGVKPCSTPASIAAQQAQDAQAVAALHCLAAPAQEFTTHVTGGAQSDAQRLADAIWNSCSSQVQSTQFAVVLDANGVCIDVQADPGAAALADCVKQALTGLSFPCLASFEICPEYAIVE